MRAIVEYASGTSPPLLRFFIHHAPHRRMARPVLDQYRRELWTAWAAAGYSTPIDWPIDLDATFINPLSPDLDNLLTALYQALDGVTGKKPTILSDDGLISQVTIRKLFL